MTNDKTMTIEEYITWMQMLELFETTDEREPPTFREVLDGLSIGNTAKFTKMIDLAEDVGLITSERLPTGKRKKRTTRSVEDWRERLYLFLCEETKEDLENEIREETDEQQSTNPIV